MSYRIAIIINCAEEVPESEVETIKLTDAKSYSNVPLRLYNIAEAEKLPRPGINLIVVAPPGNLSAWLEWTQQEETVLFIDANRVENPFSFLKQVEISSSKTSKVIPESFKEPAIIEIDEVVEVTNPTDKEALEKPTSVSDIVKTYHHNPFVKFLNSYNVTGAAHAQNYEDYFQQVLYSLDIETTTERYLLGNFSIENLKKDDVRSVILTGNAGDGKTRLCRLVWQQLSKQDFVQASKDFQTSVIDLVAECGKRIKIIKDFSDWDEQLGIDLLQELVRGIDENGIPIVFLIAANEGRLRKALQDDSLVELQQQVEAALNNKPEIKGPVVLNLNQASTSKYIPKLLQKMTNANWWRDCEGCPAFNYCPIKWNRDQLAKPIPAERLHRLYQIVEQLGKHVTFRDALIHLSYTLIGRLDCHKVQAVPPEQHPHFSSWVYYRNCFGVESDQTFQSQGMISNLRLIDVSAASNFHIDELLIKGHLNPDQNLQKLINENFRQGVDLGGELFNLAVQNYLSPADKPLLSKKISGRDKFFFDLMQWWLPHVRRKYYFEAPEELAHLYSPYRLIPLISYETMQKLLLGTTKLESDAQKEKIIKALNRIFAKLFLNDEKNLYLSSFTSLGASKLPVPVIRERFIAEKLELEPESIEPNLTKKIDIEPNYLVLTVPPSGSLSINLLLFEYLIRVSQGGSTRYLEEECGLSVTEFQKKLLANASTNEQEKVVSFFAYRGNTLEIQRLSLQDDKLEIKQDS
jgi:hypothetical protein